MGLLDELLRGAVGAGGLGNATGQRERPTQAAGSSMQGAMMALLPAILGMLAKSQSGAPAAQQGMGGLASILEQFQRAGFGEQARSWVGTGQNLPITPEAIERVLGRDVLASLARRAGVDERQAAAGVSEMLPDVVDKLTPRGEVPDLDALGASVGDLRRRLGF
jgi:uncharacterized protein YidB (DUF937 family)